ncbi:Protein N-acetyltransferase, RimJ/RimL family [Nocardioides terrae]|uniref:Protein N-acetyltransferase, RimJ/RimL family n=1 Tax=Nocardioides terrae TaxID=574651 RepID=A0A1I1IX46_9ACTN|nr:GNAT family N-acetyltransferase [Nocardioides terrae]SFC40857.1 Protein N-acetyltransferase, RimJ/RimL family [Nocardioides terrae]
MHLSPSYPIETERLLLRPLSPDDVDAAHAYMSRPEVTAYTPYEPRSREEVAARFADPKFTRTTLDAEGQFVFLGIVVKETGQLVGDALLAWHSELHRSGEVGYQLHPDHWGRGYATEAAREMLRLGFEDLGLRRIVARIDEDNPGSAAVLRRLGMRQEAVLVENEWFKGRWSTEVIFAMLDREWRDLSGGA